MHKPSIELDPDLVCLDCAKAEDAAIRKMQLEMPDIPAFHAYTSFQRITQGTHRVVSLHPRTRLHTMFLEMLNLFE